jgi:hypothetical protein
MRSGRPGAARASAGLGGSAVWLTGRGLVIARRAATFLANGRNLVDVSVHRLPGAGRGTACPAAGRRLRAGHSSVGRGPDRPGPRRPR